MKKILIIFTIILNISLDASENNLVKRYALLIGANNGGNERTILRYAETDAQNVSNVFSDIGGIENNNSILLLNPTKNSILNSFKKITKYISNENENIRTEIIFYYSGHSTEEGLLIRESLLSYIDLKILLTETNANVQIGILDSCSSGAFTLLKGGKHNAPFLVDESIKTSGHAFITSASENESAQESNLLKASFFTHYLISALRGAADTSSDGKVTLHEAFSYASNETLARTVVTQAGAQHASYDFKISGSGDIVLTDLRNAQSKLTFQDSDFGRFFIRDNEENLISEVNKKQGSKLNISIPSSMYTIIKEVDGKYYKQQIDLRKAETSIIYQKNYIEFIPEINVSRNGNTLQRDTSIDVPHKTAIFAWTTMDRVRQIKVDLSLISKAKSLEGIQISLANMIIENGNGAQFSPIFNIIGRDFSGLQLAGIFNIIGNRSNIMTLQMAGLFNISKDINGAQISLVNLADYVDGTQIGIVNINKDIKGLSIGLINISTEGINNINYKFNIASQNHTLGYQFGSSLIYQTLSIGYSNSLKNYGNINLETGLGIHIPIVFLYTEIETSLSNNFRYNLNENLIYNGSFPLFSAKLGWPIWKDLAVFVGCDIKFPMVIDDNFSFDMETSAFEDIKPSFFFGVRI